MSLSTKLGLSTLTDLKGKRILIRVDFNVPFADGKISNNQRIVAALPTIQHVLKQGTLSGRRKRQRWMMATRSKLVELTRRALINHRCKGCYSHVSLGKT